MAKHFNYKLIIINLIPTADKIVYFLLTIALKRLKKQFFIIFISYSYQIS